jgi:hypothetical protein
MEPTPAPLRDTPDTVDYRFMAHVSELLLCSRCLRNGIRARVRQVISRRHRPEPLCPTCRSDRCAG